MEKEFNSLFYDSFAEQMKKYGIEPEAAPYAAPEIQSTEEMFS